MRYGYDGVEIRLIERETDLLSRPEFRPSELVSRRRELANAGFQVCGLASSVRFDDVNAGARKKQIEIGQAYVDLAAELGASFVRVFGDVLPEHADAAVRQNAIENIAEGLTRLGEYAETIGPAILIETHGDFSDSQVTQQTMQLVCCGEVGVLWDTHHPWRFCNEELPTTFDRLGQWVRHTHWKDSIVRPQLSKNEEVHQAAQQAHELMSGHRHADYVLFGAGEFPVLECLRLLHHAGYDGWFSLEWEKMWHPEIEDPEIALPLFPGRIRTLWELVWPV